MRFRAHVLHSLLEGFVQRYSTLARKIIPIYAGFFCCEDSPLLSQSLSWFVQAKRISAYKNFAWERRICNTR